MPIATLSPRAVLPRYLAALLIGGTLGCTQPELTPPSRPATPRAAVTAPPTPEAAFARLGTADGLPQTSVWAVLQDRRGFLWAGTQDGLARFDGAAFTVYRPDPTDTGTLGGSHVWALAETPDGAVWAGTDGGGLSRFDLATERFRTYRTGPAADALCGDAVYSLAPERGTQGHGGLWVGTLTGVCRLDTATGRFAQPPALGAVAHAAALGLAAMRSGTLWIAAGGYGLARYEPDLDRLTTLAHYPDRADSPPPGWALAVAEASDGAVWAGFGGGLARVAPDGRVARALDGEVVYALRAAPGGAVWAGTHGAGLALVHADGRTVRFRPDGARATSLAGPDVGAVAVDRTGAVWVGLVGHGLARWSPDAPTFTVAASTAARRAAAGGLAADGLAAAGVAVEGLALGPDGAVWTAGAAGLGRYDGARVEPVAAAAGTCAAAPTRAVAVGRDGRLWTGGDGLCRLNTATGAAREYRYVRPTDAVGMDDVRGRADSVSLASNTVYALAVAPDGDVWVGTDEGLNAVDARTGAMRYVALHRDRPGNLSPSVYALVAARDGTVWAGTASGLYRYWPATDRLVRYRHRRDGTAAISGSAVYALREGADGTLWVGTEAGLDAVDTATGRIRREPTVAGEGHPAVRSVAEDAAGRLWLGTPRGVLRVDVAGGRALAFGRTTGWPDGEPARGAAAVTPDGRVLVGTTAGLVAVGGSALVAVPGPAPEAPLVLTGVDAEGVGVGPERWTGGRLVLPPGTDDLTLRYARLDLTQGRTTRYRTRLDRDGRDGQWSPPSGRRDAAFGQVHPGRYTFRVQAAGPDGRWRPGEARLRVRIAAPWWATVWARAVVALAVAFALVAAYRYRVDRILELAATRRHIADDLHDDIGSKMGAVALRLDLAGRADGLSPETQRQLATLAGTARAVVTDLRDAVWFVDAGHDSLADLVDRIELATEQMCAGRPHAVERPDTLPDVSLSMEHRRHVFLWVREALHNTCKHGHGTVRVRVAVDGGRLAVSVADDGPGFDVSAPGAGRGLTTLAARARSLGGESAVESAPGRGTVARLSVPLHA